MQIPSLAGSRKWAGYVQMMLHSLVYINKETNMNIIQYTHDNDQFF